MFSYVSVYNPQGFEYDSLLLPHGVANFSVDFEKIVICPTRTQWNTKTMPGQSILMEYVVAFSDWIKGERKNKESRL